MNDQLRLNACHKALKFIEDNTIIGIGTGNTVNIFIKELAKIKHRIDACVASSKQTETLLKEHNIPVINLNSASSVPLYIDSADEVNSVGEMIKGGGGALTGEKIVAAVAKKFLCIVDEKKLVKNLGEFPVAVEVIPLARSLVGREIVKLGGNPSYREGFVTDNGNIILDVYNLDLLEPIKLEDKINQIPGVVENGIFARNHANVILIGRENTVEEILV